MDDHTHGSLEARVALVADEPCPCTGCRFAARCGAVGLACSQFSSYVAGEPERKWRRSPQVPLDSIYRMIFEGRRDPATYRGGRPRNPARVPDDGYRQGPLATSSPVQRIAWMLGRSRARIVRG